MKVERRRKLNACHMVDAQHVVVLLVLWADDWKSQASDVSLASPLTHLDKIGLNQESM